jgi:hypothetical protein
MGAVTRTRARSPQRGATAVETALFFAIGGSVLAVAIPTFARELHASRFVEPVEGLGRISAAIAYSQDRPTREAFPVTAPLTPSAPPRGVRTADPEGAWDTPSWRALKFRPVAEGVPHLFAFGFDSSLGPARSAFVAHAHGDLDGDGVRSTFETRGHVTSGDPAGATLDPGMYVEAEVE